MTRDFKQRVYDRFENPVTSRSMASITQLTATSPATTGESQHFLQGRSRRDVLRGLGVTAAGAAMVATIAAPARADVVSGACGDFMTGGCASDQQCCCDTEEDPGDPEECECQPIGDPCPPEGID